MENSLNKIDSIIRDKLINYEEDTSHNFWNKLNSRLSGKGIKNVIVVLIAILSGLVFWMMMPELKTETDIENVTHTNIPNITVEPKLKVVTNGEQKIALSKETTSYNKQTKNDKTNDNTTITSDSKTEEEIIVPSGNIYKEHSQNNEYERITDYRISLLKTNTTSILSPVEANNFTVGNRDIPGTFSDNNLNVTSRFSISMEIGYDISWKQLTSEPQFDDFKNYRIKNEKPVTNLSYGIKFNYHYKNWVISTGLDYTSVGEEINYNIKETIVDPDGGYYNVDPIWANIYDQDNNLVPLLIGYEKTWIEEYKEINYKVESINQYNYIEIPFSIGYNFAFRKFSVCPSAGMSFGFLYSASGSIPQINSTEFIELDKSSKYLQKKVTNFSFGLSFEYLITPNYGIYIKPVYKQGLNSIYKNYPLSGKYRNAGVKFGISIYL